MATQHSYDHADVAARYADQRRRLEMQPELSVYDSGWPPDAICDMWDAAGRQLQGSAKVVQAAANCQGRARAAADAPEASSMSSHPSPTATIARPVAATKRLAHHDHRHERAAARSWLDCQLHRLDAHPAAPEHQGTAQARTPSSFETGPRRAHAPQRRACASPISGARLGRLRR